MKPRKPLGEMTRAEHEAYMRRNRITGLAAASALRRWRRAVELRAAVTAKNEKLRADANARVLAPWNAHEGPSDAPEPSEYNRPY